LARRLTGALSRIYRRTDREELVARMARNGIPARALADTLAKWVSMILSSSNSEQVEEAMSSLRWIKALEEAEVEAHERGPERTDQAT
jgi:hypothetical protein